jgi:hypothetical protein
MDINKLYKTSYAVSIITYVVDGVVTTRSQSLSLHFVDSGYGLERSVLTVVLVGGIFFFNLVRGQYGGNGSYICNQKNIL